MNDKTQDNERKQEERHDFFSYVWGYGLAMVLSLVAFGLIKWKGDTPVDTLLYVIGSLGFVQMIAHFKFFLHLGIHRRREDFELILFSTLILFIMVGGTIWITASLATRMAMPAGPLPPPYP